jgi:NADPH2:quinone reductase
MPDETADALAARMSDHCEGPVDVVVDPLCGVPATAALRLLANQGRLVNLGSSSQALAELLAHAAAGRLTDTHECVPLEEMPDAWARQANGEARQRLVVTLAPGV